MPVVMEAIDRMTTAEKVVVMNYLWASLSSTGERFVPVWHVEGSEPMAKAVQKRASQYGALRGKVGTSPDFDVPLDDFAEYM